MSSLESLKQFFRPTDITVAVPDDPFIVVDRNATISKLKLAERAELNGSKNYPPIGGNAPDDAEMEIIAEITEQVTRAQINATTNHRLYSERLSELALLRELSSITGADQRALGDFKATLISRKGRLALAKEAISESYKELAAFKQEHSLKRPAHWGMQPIYVWSTISISWLLESGASTILLRVNDSHGYLGGFFSALVISAVNLGGAFGVGRLIPYFNYKYIFQKFLAYIGVAFGLSLLVVWNLLAGHFRDAKASGIPNPETAAIGLFRDMPIQFDSIYSYGLLVAGILFALIAAITAYKSDDPYPGYGPIYRRHEDRTNRYADEIEISLEDLKDTRDEANDSAKAIRDELGLQFRERGRIIAARDSHRIRYREHQEYLETICNALLSFYRAANCRHRPDNQIPMLFNEQWKLKKVELPSEKEPSIESEVIRAQDVGKPLVFYTINSFS
jgi:hypothetical protein